VVSYCIHLYTVSADFDTPGEFTVLSCKKHLQCIIKGARLRRPIFTSPRRTSPSENALRLR
jgi:hypothetical protein